MKRSNELNVDSPKKQKLEEDTEKFEFSHLPGLEDISRQMQADFCTERNWDQFHSPRNILLAMVGEVGEVAELFQWRGEVQNGLPDWTEKDKKHLSHELSDVLIYLVRLADRCNIDLPAAVMEKFELNRQKYPANMVYGSSKKYNEYKTGNKEVTSECNEDNDSSSKKVICDIDEQKVL